MVIAELRRCFNRYVKIMADGGYGGELIKNNEKDFWMGDRNHTKKRYIQEV